MQITASPVPKVVRKRDGQTFQPFDIDKVKNAVRKAWIATEGLCDEDKLEKVVILVLASLDDETTDVEQIQDLVELALMRAKKYEVARAYILYRDNRARKRAARRKPDPLAVSDYIHASKYARYRPELGRREVYSETVKRVEAMHLKRFAHLPELLPHINKAFDLVQEKRVLPSMRSMQFAGPAMEAVHCRGFNCSSTLVDRPRVFAETLYLLLCGCGVGYSVQFDHVAKLPALKDIDQSNVVHHVIADTIEGWADALDALINSYIRGYYIEFSYHLIRDAGSPLKTSGGRAPGHRGLKQALDLIRNVLHNAQGRKLRPVECHRIICLAADAVLSGGIRRSACICLFSLEDGEMMSVKSSRDWFSKEPWLANANNSVVLKRGEIKKSQFKRIFEMTKNYGEPGIILVNDYGHAYNPCQPGWATVLTPDGIRTFNDISIGSTIWSGKQWTKVVKKWKTGVKPVYAYRTDCGTFYGTDNHRIVQRGEKIEVRLATTIDRAGTPETSAEIGDSHRILSSQLLGSETVYDITVDAEEHTYWTDGLLVSNCSEVGMDPTLVNPDGSLSTGFSLCNVTEINAAKLTSREDFIEAAWAATLIGSLQATYTDMSYLGPVTEAIVKRDALLGVSMTGMMDAPTIALNPELQREIANKIVEWNKKWAEILGINSAARACTIKPAGTTSLALSCVGSGIHAHHARRYIRRVTADKLEFVFQGFQKINPHMCVRKPDGKWVVEFPVEAPEGATVKEDLCAEQFMEIVKSTQQNWVIPGTSRDSRVPGLTHNVSNTITVKPDEWDFVADYLWRNQDSFTGISLLPDSGDTIYAFAPNEAIKTEDQEIRWNELVASYKPVDYYSMQESADGTDLTGETACAGGSCSIV